jgi:hypothetical protein
MKNGKKRIKPSIFPPGNPPTSLTKNALRPLDWRWERAKVTLDLTTQREPGIDDSWLVEARHHLRGLADIKAHHRPGSRSPVHVAYQIWFENSGTLRREMECRLLAGQDDATIALRCHVAERVVAAYAHLFFDVRPEFGGTGELLFKAVGHPLCDPTSCDREIAYRLAACFGGSYFVDLYERGRRCASGRHGDHANFPNLGPNSWSGSAEFAGTNNGSRSSFPRCQERSQSRGRTRPEPIGAEHEEFPNACDRHDSDLRCTARLLLEPRS